MSTEIKNTLFRFVTMRAPKLLEQATVEQYFNFIKHPSETGITGTSVFLDAAKTIPAGKTKAKSLADAATTFGTGSSIKKTQDLYIGSEALIPDSLYRFAVWLTSNRSSLTEADILERLGSNGEFVSPIATMEKRFKLWDNLFYQIITSKSPYLRDLILSVLVADFFLERREDITTEKDHRKLAQARVIIPKELFEKQDMTPKKEAMKQALAALPLNTKELDKELDLILSADLVQKYKSIIEELKKAKQIYKRNYAAVLESEIRDYEEMLADLYANAETAEKTIIDPITNMEKTVLEYVDLVIPPFVSSMNGFELENDFVEENTSTDTFNLVISLAGEHGYATFDEVISHLEKQIALGTKKIFKNTDVTQKMISTSGIILPETPVNNTGGNIFTIGATRIGTWSPITMLFSGAAAGMDIISANYQLTNLQNGTGIQQTSFSDSIINNKLAVKILLDEIALWPPSSCSIEGMLAASDGRKINLAGEFTISSSPFTLDPDTSINDGSHISVMSGKGTYEIIAIELDPELPTDIPDAPEDGSLIKYIPSGFGIKRIGIADYRKVEQEVCCYVPGEVSHIENVMASEYKEKATRRLRRTEDTTTTSNEQEKEKLTDSTSTDRFEMNQEMSSILNEDTSFGAHVSANQSWGTGNISAGADFANNTSSEESDNQAVTHAKEVTERALDRVVQKVKEERISKIIEEFEENNKHGFDNRKNNQHVSGVYRWVDKIYKNKIINYGKRLMYEFMIPEPAAFHNYAVSSKKEELGFEKIAKPIDPRIAGGDLALASHKNVLETNYQHWAAVYNADVLSPPAKDSSIGKEFSFSGMGLDGEKVWAEKASVTVPEGYKAVDAKVFATGKSMISAPNTHNCGAAATVGNLIFDYYRDGIDAGREIPKRGTLEQQRLISTDKNIPVTATSYGQYSLGLNVTIILERTPEFFEQWQIETFQSIIKAYETELEKYNAKIAELKAQQMDKVKTNPLFYRQIENTVLRKNCIEYLASHAALGEINLIKNKSVDTVQVDYDNPLLEEYAAKVKFFEQAFEWNLMSYNLYPFYWADKGKWSDLYNISESDDPTFRAFLQSGMARVVVTARPGFEEAVNWYMATGQVWNGGQVPTIDDPLFVSIVEELRETEGEVEETWESRVPTSLTVIQAGSIGLEVDQALPCDEDCADYKLFDSDGEPVLDGNGEQISTNPFKKYEAVKLEGVDNTTPPVEP
ncbi:hypothetical protein [Flavobacterium humi]|uniref:Uncharacterized protein n=1 Tax=Flavobacterium humi TaxID=2562683 RepID=A0A4Z0LBA4_9FLAO|nr:hypothetical protein [Flavobacterium humi]TGD58595.1 hypothetical protein E4635_06690 [Flavobacterium humi]